MHVLCAYRSGSLFTSGSLPDHFRFSSLQCREGVARCSRNLKALHNQYNWKWSFDIFIQHDNHVLMALFVVHNAKITILTWDKIGEWKVNIQKHVPTFAYRGSYLLPYLFDQVQVQIDFLLISQILLRDLNSYILGSWSYILDQNSHYSTNQNKH